MTIVWHTGPRRETMAEDATGVSDPAWHQPTKADIEEDVNLNVTPEALACAAASGCAEWQRNEAVAR